MMFIKRYLIFLLSIVFVFDSYSMDKYKFALNLFETSMLMLFNKSAEFPTELKLNIRILSTNIDISKEFGNLNGDVVVLPKEKNIIVVQIRVLDQFLTLQRFLNEYKTDFAVQMKKQLESKNFNPNIGVGGGEESCGYQAIKNGILIFREFTGYDNIENLKKLLNNCQDVRYAHELFGRESINKLLELSNEPGPWRQKIILKRKTYEDKAGPTYDDKEREGEYLSDGDIADIYESERDKNSLYPDFSIIGGDDIKGGTTEEVGDMIFEYIINQYEQKEKFSHIFFVTDGLAHWATVVLQKMNNKKYYIIADSDNKARYVIDTKKGGQRIQKVIREIIERIKNL